VSTPQRDVWAETLVELAATNPDILVLDADLATSTKADKFAAAYPDRFLEMGIAEQGMVGAAAGLSFEGFVPWLSSFGIFFSNRALDQVRMSVAQTHANVKIGAAYTGLMAGLAGKTHVDVSDLATLRAMPGMTILAPADAIETAAMTRWATETPGPVYLRLGRESGPDVFDASYRFEPGRVHRLREGADVLLVATGQQTARTLAAAELLAADGVSAAVLHVPSIKPVDAAAIAAAAAAVPLVVTTEEHTVIGGLGGLVAEIVTAGEPRKVIRIGIEDTWGESAPNAWLLDRHGLTPERVAARVLDAVRGGVARSA
jgi:transketolase